MSDGRLIAKFIGEIKREQAETAEAAMLRPQRELFAMGEASGKYQGLQKALDLLDDILSDQLKEEQKS